MNRAERIENTLAQSMELAHLEILDESGNHHVPDGAQSHYKVVAVADEFDGQTRIARHRRINTLLQGEFAAGMHALALHAYTPAEWQARFGSAPLSPPCAGGSAREAAGDQVG
ncbi:MAG: BolA/IbaG family iron-sulfur metabolism protein [Pseudomonadota bacterium]